MVISDWMMPGLTGLELCRKIRADPIGGYTYFIMVTSQGGHDEILEGMIAGADDYLVKPLDPDDLQARLIAADTGHVAAPPARPTSGSSSKG